MVIAMGSSMLIKATRTMENAYQKYQRLEADPLSSESEIMNQWGAFLRLRERFRDLASPYLMSRQDAERPHMI